MLSDFNSLHDRTQSDRQEVYPAVRDLWPVTSHLTLEADAQRRAALAADRLAVGHKRLDETRELHELAGTESVEEAVLNTGHSV